MEGPTKVQSYERDYYYGPGSRCYIVTGTVRLDIADYVVNDLRSKWISVKMVEDRDGERIEGDDY